jgi:hypothetical protein
VLDTQGAGTSPGQWEARDAVVGRALMCRYGACRGDVRCARSVRRSRTRISSTVPAGSVGIGGLVRNVNSLTRLPLTLTVVVFTDPASAANRGVYKLFLLSFGTVAFTASMPATNGPAGLFQRPPNGSWTASFGLLRSSKTALCAWFPASRPGPAAGSWEVCLWPAQAVKSIYVGLGFKRAALGG